MSEPSQPTQLELCADPESDEVIQEPRGDREAGQGMVEYALILVLIAIVVIVILAVVGNQVSNVFSNVSSGL